MVIGVPWLFWVTILLCGSAGLCDLQHDCGYGCLSPGGVLYVCAIVLRSTVSGESMSLFGRPGSAKSSGAGSQVVRALQMW